VTAPDPAPRGDAEQVPPQAGQHARGGQFSDADELVAAPWDPEVRAAFRIRGRPRTFAEPGTRQTAAYKSESAINALNLRWKGLGLEVDHVRGPETRLDAVTPSAVMFQCGLGSRGAVVTAAMTRSGRTRTAMSGSRIRACRAAVPLPPARLTSA
jgi:hypothetical protein